MTRRKRQIQLVQLLEGFAHAARAAGCDGRIERFF